MMCQLQVGVSAKKVKLGMSMAKWKYMGGVKVWVGVAAISMGVCVKLSVTAWKVAKPFKSEMEIGLNYHPF
jgi:hypothetical protein